MDKVKVAVWGPGYFGRKWMQEVQGSDDGELVAVVSRSPGRAGELARELGVERIAVVEGPSQARAAGADAVIIAVPQALHHDAALAALESGLHVLLEKPLALTLDEGRAIVAAHAARPQQVFMVTQNFRWRPHTLALRQAVQGGAVGRVAHVGLSCRQAIKRGTTDAWRERMEDPYLGDFAIHHIDLLRYVTGLDVEQAFAVSYRPPGSWLDGRSAASALLTLTGGVTATYDGTMVASGLLTPQEGLVTVIGETGVLHLDGKYQVTLSASGEEPIPLACPAVPGGELAHGLRELVAAVRHGRRPETELGDNFRSFAALMAVVESAATGRPVTVEAAT